ncbi:cor protein [Citrobacter sp. RHBSTW-00570]|uniref:phage exclusion lipoprotein Cor n=1 Tax=Citrobacter sp. RHBSTW-00570 TaxID=2742655 RepID=UPI002017512E|nr:cor protein [Citrobacter sp. RHBSTW-00570]
MKIILIVLAFLSLTACSGTLEKKLPLCTATAMIGDQETDVLIYGIRKIVNQTQYQAGYPFNWRWVNKNNFTHSNCPQ